MSAEAVAIVGVGVALLAVLVPLLLTLHGRVVAELGEVRRDFARPGRARGPHRGRHDRPVAPGERHPGGDRAVTAADPMQHDRPDSLRRLARYLRWHCEHGTPRAEAERWAERADLADARAAMFEAWE